MFISLIFSLFYNNIVEIDLAFINFLRIILLHHPTPTNQLWSVLLKNLALYQLWLIKQQIHLGTQTIQPLIILLKLRTHDLNRITSYFYCCEFYKSKAKLADFNFFQALFHEFVWKWKSVILICIQFNFWNIYTSRN